MKLRYSENRYSENSHECKYAAVSCSVKHPMPQKAEEGGVRRLIFLASFLIASCNIVPPQTFSQVRYNLLIAALEECSRDNLDFLKEKATKVGWHSRRL